MSMRDDCWPPDASGSDPERDAADAEEARVYDILRRALSSDPTAFGGSDSSSPPGDAWPYATSLGVREPLPNFATYRRMIAHMTQRDGFEQGAVCVPARFAPQLIMQTTSAGYRVLGQRAPTRVGAPPMVRISVYAPRP